MEASFDKKDIQGSESRFDTNGLSTKEKTKLYKEQMIKEAERHNRNLGWLGKFFGYGENNSKHISLFLCFLLLICFFGIVMIVISFDVQESKMTYIATLWGGVINIISAFIGYLFGKGYKSNNEKEN